MRKFLKFFIKKASGSVSLGKNLPVFHRQFSTINKPDDPKQTIETHQSPMGTKGEASSSREAVNKDLLNGLSEYKEALSFFQNGKYRISEEFFRRTLKILEGAGQMQTDNYIHVLKKLALNKILLRRYTDAETHLEKIIEIMQLKTSSDALIYAEYSNLFVHCLKTNLNKAIILGKALLSEEEKKALPVAYQKLFLFKLGTAYLLKGNFIDAKKRLRECLKMQPNHLLRGFALNNLAVASWWHKYPNFRDFTDNDEEGPSSASYGEGMAEYSAEQIDHDFENVIPLLKNAIFNIENVENSSDFDKKKLTEKLLDQNNILPADFNKYDPSAVMLFQNKNSGVPLINIGEFLFNTNPEKRNEAAFWFKYALKFFESNDPNNIDRCLITLALFCSSSQQFIKAEGLFRKALEMLEESDSYNKVLCLQLYGNMLKRLPERVREGEKLIAEAYAKADDLPFWSNKIIHVSVPEIEL